MDILLAKFRKYYVLSHDVAVDEPMIGFTGRLSFWQYMPAKPIKRGIKCWMLCDSRSGYLSNFEVYLGRNTTNRDQGLAYNVVMSSEARRQLHGTVSTNRKGFPAELKKPPWPTPTWPDAGAPEGKGSKRPSTRKAHTKKANPKKAHFERVPKSPTFNVVFI